MEGWRERERDGEVERWMGVGVDGGLLDVWRVVRRLWEQRLCRLDVWRVVRRLWEQRLCRLDVWRVVRRLWEQRLCRLDVWRVVRRLWEQRLCRWRTFWSRRGCEAGEVVCGIFAGLRDIRGFAGLGRILRGEASGGGCVAGRCLRWELRETWLA